MKFDQRELGTVLAALREWQQIGSRKRSIGTIGEIATDGDAFKPLSNDEIDGLCDRLNQPQNITS